MNRQQETIGTILEVDLEDSHYAYAQILKHGYVFFDFRTNQRLKNLDLLLSKKVLFILSVYKDVVTQGHWLKVGKLPIRKEFEILPMKFKQDVFNKENYEIYDPNTGESSKATREQITGLERAAVWEASSVEERIRDHYKGKSNVWVEKLKP